MKKIFLLLALLPVFASQAQQNGYSIGSNAADFKLKNIDGQMYSQASAPDAKGFIVIFTCNHCPFSKAYEDRIIEIHKKYASLGYPVVAINPNDAKTEPEDSYENMIKRAKEKNFPFPYLLDENQELAKAYGAKRTPHVFVLTRDGDKLRVDYIGAIDDNFDDPSAVKVKYLEDALESLLKGKKPVVNQTKAIGCSIKWRQG